MMRCCGFYSRPYIDHPHLLGPWASRDNAGIAQHYWTTSYDPPGASVNVRQGRLRTLEGPICQPSTWNLDEAALRGGSTCKPPALTTLRDGTQPGWFWSAEKGPGIESVLSTKRISVGRLHLDGGLQPEHSVTYSTSTNTAQRRHPAWLVLIAKRRHWRGLSIILWRPPLSAP